MKFPLQDLNMNPYLLRQSQVLDLLAILKRNLNRIMFYSVGSKSLYRYKKAGVKFYTAIQSNPKPFSRFSPIEVNETVARPSTGSFVEVVILFWIFFGLKAIFLMFLSFIYKEILLTDNLRKTVETNDLPIAQQNVIPQLTFLTLCCVECLTPLKLVSAKIMFFWKCVDLLPCVKSLGIYQLYANLISFLLAKSVYSLSQKPYLADTLPLLSTNSIVSICRGKKKIVLLPKVTFMT